jgi:hypothetical protein
MLLDPSVFKFSGRQLRNVRISVEDNVRGGALTTHNPEPTTGRVGGLVHDRPASIGDPALRQLEQLVAA